MAWFAQPFFKEVDIPLKWFGFIWATLNFSVGISSYHAYRLEQIFSKNNLLLFISICVSGSFYFLGKSETQWGILWILFIYLLRGIATPVLRNYINKITYSEIRATVLSIRSFIIRSTFAVTAPFLGWIADHYTLSNSFWILGFFIGLISAICTWKLSSLSND